MRRRSGLPILGQWLVGCMIVLLCFEVALRLIFGNVGGGRQFFTCRPGDGRTVALLPEGEFVYTGHWLRTPPVLHEANSEGYRGRVLPRGTSKRPRIALIGDSFTYGVGVANENTFATRLDKAFGNRVDVINFGIPGLNLPEIIEQYEYFARAWKPAVVLVFLYSNDMSPSLCEGKGVYRLLRSDILATLLKHVYLVRIPYLGALRSRQAKQHERPVHTPQQVMAHLRRLAAETGEDRTRLGIVFFGFPVPVDRQTELVEELERDELPYLDLTHLLTAAHLLPREGHLNLTGHRKVAAAIEAWLRLSVWNSSSS